MIYLETERLRFRDWEAEDLEPFRQMNADETVMRYFPNRRTAEETDAFHRSIQVEHKACGFGLYAVEAKATGEFIGFIGFHRAVFESDFTPCIEIGWRLRQEAWGQGFATEGAAACLRYGFETLGLTEVYSFTAEANTPSRSVMIKIGMQYVKSFDHPKVEPGHPLRRHVLYRIARP
ncbi:GNAT family N-acetyltransferase [Paenibacillus sacheonensis]|uniref:GNAT family N-acetyltransferase n=1 Tax=Paenibacillus sacheonensis TaxID=742054 RepID=A0A7X4YTM7_9BACL|nr:GNAT family N-acetyltransferase [Paenibacillus sacheonensis]MBM7568531.1 ribosomal-protein-alanine N-acetyltransferase [Paenibacillus sacheonensis]NBC72356.1 GNAT family N-acetyltransferase [Paenibacillus sacheonensis]